MTERFSGPGNVFVNYRRMVEALNLPPLQLRAIDTLLPAEEFTRPQPELIPLALENGPDYDFAVTYKDVVWTAEQYGGGYNRVPKLLWRNLEQHTPPYLLPDNEGTRPVFSYRLLDSLLLADERGQLPIDEIMNKDTKSHSLFKATLELKAAQIEARTSE
jgi:hypothetical protein